MRRAPGISCASSRPSSTGTILSPVRCNTSVGTLSVGSTWRTSIVSLRSIRSRSEFMLAA